MSRSFLSTLNKIAREADRASRAEARQHAAQIRAQERLDKLNEKQAKQEYLADRQAETEDENQAIAEVLKELACILSTGLSRNPTIPLEKLYRQATADDLPTELKELAEPNKASFEPIPLGFFAGLVPGARKKQIAAIANGNAKYMAALHEFKQLSVKRNEMMNRLHAEATAFNQQLDAVKAGLPTGEPAAVKAYAELVLDHSPYPDGFGDEVRVGFVAESKQLVIDLQVPLMADAVPEMDHYKYVKAQDAIVGVKKPEKTRQNLYSDAIAQTSLRVLHELFTADLDRHIQIITLNVYVEAIHPSTGKMVQPYLLSVRVARDEFTGLNLEAVDPIACLKHLKAAISRSAAELIPVKPIVDINMIDPRFIEEQDVLSTLDTRPNLMELSPSEFEALITNLFQAMGLDAKLTQASRDGGVDCVAFDLRPVLGGKVVIQAKRYKNTVGVSAVRDLFGTMHNEGASKGILVTTSGFGKAAYAFADGKPIELLTGSNLLFLLREHARIDAKIEPPEGWVDPVFDLAE